VHAPGAPGGKLPFSSAPFDDAGNERVVPVQPSPANVKKPLIAPEFDN
jgi:hypothetical protein